MGSCQWRRNPPANTLSIHRFFVWLSVARALSCRSIIPPWILTFVIAARGLLPLRFRRQASAGPTTIAARVLPVDPDDRKIASILQVDRVPLIRRFQVAGIFH